MIILLRVIVMKGNISNWFCVCDRYKFEILVCEGRHFDVDHAKIYTASKSPMTITDVKDEQTYMVAVRIVTHDGLRSHCSEPITVRRFSSKSNKCLLIVKLRFYT